MNILHLYQQLDGSVKIFTKRNVRLGKQQSWSDYDTTGKGSAHSVR
jgi:hypothetical protein